MKRRTCNLYTDLRAFTCKEFVRGNANHSPQTTILNTQYIIQKVGISDLCLTEICKKKLIQTIFQFKTCLL